MIYKKRLLKRELSDYYIGNRFDFSRILLHAGFLALLSFSLHFLFQTMYESVLTERFPEIMLPSYFSALYMFSIVSFVYFILIFIRRYEEYTFVEIKFNNFYVLNKMGYNVGGLIIRKIFSKYLVVIAIYTLGFIFNILATSLLNYALVMDYFFSLYLMGIVDVLFVITITMTNSLYVEGRQQTILATVLSAAGIIIIKVISKYYDIVSNRVLMQNISYMLNPKYSIYITSVIVMFIICMILIGSIASIIAKFCTVNPLENEENYYLIDAQRTSSVLDKNRRNERMSSIANVFNIVLIIIVSLAIAFNGVVLFLSATQKSADGSIGRIVPLVFQSSTMEDEIMKNDLVLFEKIDVQAPLTIGDIVRYEYNNKFEVAQVQEILEDEKVVTDIIKYPAMAQKGAMKRTLDREVITARHKYSNRELGALILFANTMFGRILMLLVPAIMVFYHKQIVKFVNDLSKKRKEQKRNLD